VSAIIVEAAPVTSLHAIGGGLKYYCCRRIEKLFSTIIHRIIMRANDLIQRLLSYKIWANEELFGLLLTLPDAEYTSEKSVATRILNHVYVVDRIFYANMRHQKHGYTALNTVDTPHLAELRDAAKATDQQLLTYAKELDDNALAEVVDFTFVDGSPGKMSRDEMLMHLVMHGGYHRGAVGRILAQRSLQPPRDTLTVFLHSQSPSLPV